MKPQYYTFRIDGQPLSASLSNSSTSKPITQEQMSALPVIKARGNSKELAESIDDLTDKLVGPAGTTIGKSLIPPLAKVKKEGGIREPADGDYPNPPVSKAKVGGIFYGPSTVEMAKLRLDASKQLGAAFNLGFAEGFQKGAESVRKEVENGNLEPDVENYLRTHVKNLTSELENERNKTKFFMEEQAKYRRDVQKLETELQITRREAAHLRYLLKKAQETLKQIGGLMEGANSELVLDWSDQSAC